MTNIFALTTRGLETISAAEIAALPGVSVSNTAYRRIAASAESLVPLLSLRTVDDVYLDLATWEGIGHMRDTLAVLQWYATQLDLTAAAETISALRPLPEEPAFSITASFVGRRNYSTDEIKVTLSEGIRAQYPWHYTPDDRTADLNLRLFVEHEHAFVGVRLGRHPQHERPYKVVERPGALKPPVAAAMLTLVEARPAHRLLDPCCGSGTILVEAGLLGITARGGDFDPEAVQAARANLQAAQLVPSVDQWDARHLRLETGSIDRVVTNLPWGRQIEVDPGLYHDICREVERVLAPGGRVAFLTSTPENLHFERLHAAASIEISLFGQKPTITVCAAQ